MLGSASAGGVPPTAEPQLAQNRASDRFGSPQAGQLVASGEPQLSQNRLPGRFSVPHELQFTPVPPSIRRRVPEGGSVGNWLVPLASPVLDGGEWPVGLEPG